MNTPGNEHFTFKSADRKTDVHAYVWMPVTRARPRAVIQLSHGMCEYVTRYDEWARRFTDAGYVFCGNDHLGHGQTAGGLENLGYTVARGGADFLVEDLHTMTAWIRKRFPGVPIVLYGHSMGSFAARLYLSRYGNELDAALLSGTAGPEKPTGVALALTHRIARKEGDRARNRFLTSLAFGSYNKHYRQENDPVSWLTRDPAVREAYRNDPYCTFTFTAAGYDTLFSLLSAVSAKEWAKKVPAGLPVFLFAGDGDPVGNYGRGVLKVAARLKKAGCADVRCKIYPGGRHELHNETCRDEVFGDITAFLADVLEKGEKSES